MSSFTDDFSSNTAANYSYLYGTGLAISAGYATAGADEWNGCGVVNNMALSSADHYIDFTAELLTTGTIGAIVRSNGVRGYALYIYYDQSQTILQTFDGTNETWIGTFIGTTSFTNGFNRFRLEANGTTFTLKHWNGSGWDVVGSPITDSTYTTGNQVGFWSRNNGSKPRVDTITGGALVDPATLTQSAYRFLNDDGSESTATFMAAINTPASLAPGATLRIRLQIDSTNNADARQFKLQYRQKPSGGSFGEWADVN